MSAIADDTPKTSQMYQVKVYAGGRKWTTLDTYAESQGQAELEAAYWFSEQYGFECDRTIAHEIS